MNDRLILIFVLFVCVWNTKAQDPVFSQSFFIKQTLNPAFVGFQEETFIGAIHRTQWPTLDLKVDTDYVFFNTWKEDINSGLGISVMNQREQFTRYSLSQMNLSYAFRIQIDSDWYLRLALDAGLGFKSVAFQNLVFSDQFDIITGSISNTSADPSLFNDQVYYPDLSAGMMFNNESTWIGVSIKHLNTPNIAFSSNGSEPLPMFYSINAGYEFLLADFIDIDLFPYSTNILLSANYMQQGNLKRLDLTNVFIFEAINFGITAVTNPLKKNKNGKFLTGINLFTGMDIAPLKFGISYDFNTTNIMPTGGVYELSLIYQFEN